MVDILNIRRWHAGDSSYDGDSPDVISQTLRDAFKDAAVPCRWNVSAGCILRHKTTGELRYFHSSSNNATAFARPRLVLTNAGLDGFVSEVVDHDFAEQAVTRRPNTEWTLLMVSNLTFYIYKMLAATRIGSARQLPEFVRRNQHLLAMESIRGKPIEDMACFFRCIAIVLACRCKGRCACQTQAATRELTRRAYDTFAKRKRLKESMETFKGVTLTDLHELESLFNLRVYVYSLREDGASTVVWLSRRTDGRPMHLNLHEDHFSLIKDPQAFTKSFVCDVCGRQYTRRTNLTHHKCQVSREERLKFPGGAFGPPKSVFQKVEERFGLELKKQFYSYRIVFDIECMLVRDNLPSRTQRVTYNSRHELLSVSLSSNVPGHKRPICLIRERGESIRCRTLQNCQPRGGHDAFALQLFAGIHGQENCGGGTERSAIRRSRLLPPRVKSVARAIESKRRV